MAVTRIQRELADIFEVPLSLIEAIQKATGDDKDDSDKDKKKSKDTTDDKDADGQDDKSDKKPPFGKDADDEDGEDDKFAKNGEEGNGGDEEWTPDEGDPNGIGTGEQDAEEEAMREKAEDEVAADLAKRYNTSLDQIAMYPSSDGIQFTK